VQRSRHSGLYCPAWSPEGGVEEHRDPFQFAEHLSVACSRVFPHFWGEGCKPVVPPPERSAAAQSVSVREHVAEDDDAYDDMRDAASDIDESAESAEMDDESDGGDDPAVQAVPTTSLSPLALQLSLKLTRPFFHQDGATADPRIHWTMALLRELEPAVFSQIMQHEQEIARRSSAQSARDGISIAAGSIWPGGLLPAADGMSSGVVSYNPAFGFDNDGVQRTRDDALLIDNVLSLHCAAVDARSLATAVRGDPVASLVVITEAVKYAVHLHAAATWSVPTTTAANAGPEPLCRVAASSVGKDFGRLVDDPMYTDFCITATEPAGSVDGELTSTTLRTHRWLLKYRCSVFDAMLGSSRSSSGSFAEALTGHMDLGSTSEGGTDASTLRRVLRYLATDEAPDASTHPRKSWSCWRAPTPSDSRAWQHSLSRYCSGLSTTTTYLASSHSQIPLPIRIPLQLALPQLLLGRVGDATCGQAP